ncbi:integral membrane sensor signal transduction histidine kinase [Thermosinus carboxydivorans Nor1]|uniref:histidine kinase n=1 Tax=Thermosinus carboxydivorans Nor1 TaxID=401526 RepID=A1HRN1_9FIRM|nr:HAMP domain-containing sensor histidine kinase [Thermosinus carboxydivorans]EAX47355.1 integral membrane sensor signal transduction histidine kinase [Thermosinus carboxydivorans Nor1]
MYSLTYRITGLMFSLVAITVFTMSYLANYQMEVHFSAYLNQLLLQNMLSNISMGSMMGTPEQAFLANIHRSLVWYGAGILVIGLVASYALARSITVPLRRLSAATEAIEQGKLGHTVDINSNDEVGRLANTFNRMSRALAENNRLRKRLLADIAHELKTPLSVIQGNLEGMLEGVVETSPEQLHSLYEETVYLNKIINELRELSLAEAGQLTLERQLTDVNPLVSRAVNMLKPLADEKKIKLACSLQHVPEISIDVMRINQVLYNLLSNAVRYTPANGKIEAVTAVVNLDSREYVAISIRDNGKGISADDLPHIFEHFYRADFARDRKSGGSGIGLAIVKQLVELHGGKVEAKSELGKGSEFTVYLPVN